MSEEEQDVYRALQQHMNAFPVGFPKKQGGAEIRLLKRLFTPKEAEIAAKLRFTVYPVETLDVIYERVKASGISKVDLEQILDRMAKKGLISYKKEGKTKYYGNALWAIGILEFQVDKLTKELLADISQFYHEANCEEVPRTGITQLRTIPIEQSITPEDSIASYDNVRQLIKKAKGPFIVANCLCRQMHDLEGEPCKATNRRELCIGIGAFAKQYIDLGWGREVTKEELLEIIQENEEEGLVLQPTNAKTIDFLCSCCGCCCLALGGAKRAPRPVEFFSTNYYVEVDPELCIGCETCVERCQMDAPTLENGIISINLDRCIGCGVCVANCPSDALKLVKKRIEHIPPNNLEDLYEQIEAKRLELSRKNST
jgi:electron transport complex protein RnfB